METITHGKYIFERDTQNLILRAKESNPRCRFGFKLHFAYRFKKLEQLEDYQTKFLEQVTKAEQEKINKKLRLKEARNQPNPFKIGDIFYESWGYDQTNVDFYEIIEVKAKSVVIKEIGGERRYTNFMAGKVKPVKGSFSKNAEPLTKIVQWSKYGESPKPYLAGVHGYLSLHEENEEHYFSTYA